jgi:hypothetical protein
LASRSRILPLFDVQFLRGGGQARQVLVQLREAADRHPVEVDLVLRVRADEPLEDPLHPPQAAADLDVRLAEVGHVFQVPLEILQVLRPEALFHELGADLPVHVPGHGLEQLRMETRDDHPTLLGE